MDSLLKLLEQHSDLSTPKCVEKLLTKVSALLGNQFYDLFVAFEPTRLDGQTLTIDNYPLSPDSHCGSHRYTQLEIMLRYCKENAIPLKWKNAKKQFSEIEPPVCCEVTQGISIPIRGINGEIGMLSLANSPSWNSDNTSDLAIAQLVTPLITQNLANIALALNSTSDSISLTEREKQCLTLAADGKSSNEIAEELGCKERTIKFHLANASQKLGAIIDVRPSLKPFWVATSSRSTFNRRSRPINN
ncbi:helix-turn-helix transcriptional regulator [Vibrio sonorensis]|uniref:helix-turn-helix transcriptional regulator n=1 Tax=Vibrio sonorensis TaxID=1004316 RepID=UPI0008D914FE|nr:LuxR family transcriptional regulator [Vibrio sonorensis]